MNSFSIKFMPVEVKAGAQRKKKTKRSIKDIPHDLSFAYPLKATFEGVFGRKTFYKLKETSDLNTWKKESIKLLKAIKTCIDETVQVYDEIWKEEVHEIISGGEHYIKDSDNITELFAYLATTFIRLSFLQVGFLPNRTGRDVSLLSKYWKFDGFRSVQYIQTEIQKENLKEWHARRFS